MWAWGTQKEIGGTDILPGGGGDRSAQEDPGWLFSFCWERSWGGDVVMSVQSSLHLLSVNSQNKPGLPHPGRVLPEALFHF